jgi:hypothetical protein
VNNSPEIIQLKTNTASTDNSNFPLSVVDIATGYGLDDLGFGVLVPEESRIFSSPQRPDGLWGTASLPSNGYGELFPPGYSGRGVI